MDPVTLTMITSLIAMAIKLAPEVVKIIEEVSPPNKDELIQQIKDAQASVPVWE